MSRPATPAQAQAPRPAAGAEALEPTAFQTGPDLRLLPGACAAWALAGWATGADPAPVLIVAVALILALVLLLGYALRSLGPAATRSGPRHLPLLAGLMLAVAMVTAVVTSTGVRLHEREADPLTIAGKAHQVATFSGSVIGDPKQITPKSASGEQLWVVQVAVHELTVRGHARSSSSRLAIFGAEPWSTLVAGEHIRATGSLKEARSGDESAAVVFPRRPPVIIDRGPWIWRGAERLRTGLRTACRHLPADARGLLPGLVVGDTSELSDGLKSDLQAAGLTHLTAVSGGNVAIIAAVVVTGIGALGGGLRLRALGTAVAIAGFVVLARPEPSVLRAAVMGGFALVGLLLARPGAGVPMLASTAVVLLVADPWLSRSFGFGLSVLATAGLLLLVPAWLQRFERMPRSVVLAIGVPLAAQLVTGPVTVLLNPVISLVAVPANLLVAAAVGPATIAGVLAAILSLFWPWGAQIVAYAGGLATEWIAVVAHRAAAVPAGSVPWPEGLSGSLLLTGITVLGLVLSMRRAWISLGLVITAVAGCLIVPRWIPSLGGSGSIPRDWAVLQCDVGQGSSTVLRSGPHRAVIVDTGPDPGLMDQCLRRAGVTTLDLVVITHFHADHAGGLAGAVHGRGHPPILVSPLAAPVDQAREVASEAAALGEQDVVVSTGRSGRTGTGDWAVSWRLFSPPRSSWFSHAAEPGKNEDLDGTQINNASLVLEAEVQGLRVMALGDVEPDSQRALLRTIRGAGAGGAAGSPDQGLAPVDVVIVAHHGSAQQEARLYEWLRPRVALIGVGAGNDYGHPSASALALLRRIGALTLRTDTQGELAVCGPSDRLRVATTK